MPTHTHKQTRRIRTATGDVLGLPEDVHAALSEEMTAYGYETMWYTAIAAIRHGVKVLRIQRLRADEIYNEMGNSLNGNHTASNKK